MKKKLLVFRFENVLMNIEPCRYCIQKKLWSLLKELKKGGEYQLILLTSLGFESFARGITALNEVSETVHSNFDRIISSHQPDRQLDDVIRFAEKNKIELSEIVFFGNYYSDYKAAKETGIEFIAVIDHLPETQLLQKTLPQESQTHPVLLEEFLNNYLELAAV